MADCRFGKRYRLLKTGDFSSVFALRQQKSRAWLHILQADNLLGHARLGVVVGKKTAKRANRRNYMKRVIREWFRCHKHDLPAHDYVIRVRRPFEAAQAGEVRRIMVELLLSQQR